MSQSLLRDVRYIGALVVYHGDFSSIGMALRVFDCAEDVVICFFFEEEASLWVCHHDFAEFFDDEGIFGL